MDTNRKNGYLKEGETPEERLKNMAMEDIRKSAKELKSVFMGQMEHKLNEMMDDVVSSLENSDMTALILTKSSHESNFMKDKRKATKPGKLPEKEFRSRPSPLTELLKVPHFQTIHHIFVAVLIIIMVHTIIVDLFETGSIDLGFNSLWWAFGNPQIALKLLFFMHFSATFLLYPAFYFWAIQRHELKIGYRRLFDYFALGSVFIYFIAFIYYPASVLRNNITRPALNCAVAMEQCRLLMKMYAFIRSNCPRALKFSAKITTNTTTATTTTTTTTIASSNVQSLKEHESNGLNGQNVENFETELRQRKTLVKNEEIELQSKEIEDYFPCPEYSKYLYFLFAPTLIYKDDYPRTKKIQWNYVLYNFGQCIGCIVYANFLLFRFCSLYFSKFGLVHMGVKELIDGLFMQMIPGIIFLMLAFYLVLHSWHNAWAEMLCFADRLFYKDWWNKGSFAKYYSHWNVLVHDFLYNYVFKDSFEYLGCVQNKALPTILVFFLSSLFHEYIIALSLNFFYPVMLFLFGVIGLAFVFVRIEDSAIGNIFIWIGLIMGTGIMIGSYTIEFYARINCKPSDYFDFFIPRSWNCIPVST